MVFNKSMTRVELMGNNGVQSQALAHVMSHCEPIGTGSNATRPFKEFEYNT